MIELGTCHSTKKDKKEIGPGGRRSSVRGKDKLLFAAIGSGGRGEFRTPVSRHCFSQEIKMSSAVRLLNRHLYRGDHFDLLEKRIFYHNSMFYFFYT